MLKRIFCLSAIILLCAVISSAETLVEVQGRVYEDVNGNGAYDKGKDRAVKGMLISDGDTVIACKKDGTYKLHTSRGNSIFPILPAGYDMPSQVPNSSFVNIPVQGDDTKMTIDIAVVADANGLNDNFTLNAVGDVQVRDLHEMEYANRSIFTELAEAGNNTFNMWLGDLCFDNLAMLPILKNMMDFLPSKSWTIMGNHDRDYVMPLSHQNNTYNSIFGAADFSFNRGNVHFIVLNTIIGTDKKKYREGLRPQQIRFIKNDLAYVPAKKQIVLVMHAPISGFDEGLDQLLGVLEGRGHVLAIAGHWHKAIRRFVHGKGVTIHEVTAGSTCGYWWRGERDWNNVPSSIQYCGTPRNYHVFSFTKDGYNFKFKGVGMDANKQMSIHVAGIDTTDVHVPELAELPKGMIVANIWGACDSTEVTCVVDGKDLIPMTRTVMVSPEVARSNALTAEKVYPTKYSRKPVTGKQKSPHVWTVTLPEKYLTGSHSIVINAKDNYGLSCKGARTFYLK